MIIQVPCNYPLSPTRRRDEVAGNATNRMNSWANSISVQVVCWLVASSERKSLAVQYAKRGRKGNQQTDELDRMGCECDQVNGKPSKGTTNTIDGCQKEFASGSLISVCVIFN